MEKIRKFTTMRSYFHKKSSSFLKVCYFLLALTFFGCENQQSIVNNVDEREANEIIVFLASKGITAVKMAAVVQTGTGGPSNMWNIAVPETQMTDAMAILNQNGLPRRKGVGLLDLFGATGMMTSDKKKPFVIKQALLNN